MTRVWEVSKPKAVKRYGVPDDLRGLIFDRQSGKCACCGRVLGDRLRGWQAHHRKRRSQGGQDSACNLVGLLNSCHRSVHDHPQRSYDFGYLVRREDDPASAPLVLHDGSAVLLCPDGSYAPSTFQGGSE